MVSIMKKSLNFVFALPLMNHGSVKWQFWRLNSSSRALFSNNSYLSGRKISTPWDSLHTPSAFSTKRMKKHQLVNKKVGASCPFQASYLYRILWILSFIGEAPTMMLGETVGKTPYFTEENLQVFGGFESIWLISVLRVLSIFLMNFVWFRIVNPPRDWWSDCSHQSCLIETKCIDNLDITGNRR